MNVMRIWIGIINVPHINIFRTVSLDTLTVLVGKFKSRYPY